MGLKAKEWTLSGLAVELGMDRRAIGKRLAGVRVAGKFRQAPTYWLADVVAAIYGLPAAEGGQPAGAAKLDLNAESARLKKAQADKTELEVRVLRGDLIPGETVAAVWADFATACRAKFITLPSTAAPRVVGLTVREAESELRGLVNQGLGELAEYEPDQFRTRRQAADYSHSQDDGTTAGADSERMGRRKQGAEPRGKRGTGPVAD